MAQDIFVMPLWRFKAGDFTSPVEEVTGLKPTVISLSDLPSARSRPPWHLRLLAAMGIIEFVEPSEQRTSDPAARRARAVQEVSALKTRLSQLTGRTVDWEDEGAVQYNEQFHASSFLRTFAAWHDHREAMPEFLPAPSDKDHSYYPVWDQPAPTVRRFPHLVEHSLHTGYLVPVPFEGVHAVEPFKVFGHWDMHHDVASSQVMLREIDELLASSAELKATGGSPRHVKFVESALDWAKILRKICCLSVEHQVPVIFYG